MKRPIKLVAFALCATLFSISCSETADKVTAPNGGPPLTVSVSGGPDLSFDLVTGQVDTDYEVFELVHATFTTSQTNGTTSLRIDLNDDDPDSFPFRDGSPFPIDGTIIDANIRFIQGSDTSFADTGSITVSNFMRTTPSSNVITISGSINAQLNDGPICGKFSNVLLDCGECE